MTAVAVERGTDATRLVVAGPDGRAEPVAVLPAGTPVATAVEQLVGPSAGPVVVVCPPAGAVPDGPVPDGTSTGRVDGSARRGSAGSAADGSRCDGTVPGLHGRSAGSSDLRRVPAPVAVLAGRAGRFLVVDAGRSGTTLTVVDDGGVRSTVRVPVGGDRLDVVVATATGCPADPTRRARETLSTADRVDVPGFGPLDASTVDALLRPELETVVGHVPSMAADVDEVVVAGGIARTPLLAEMLDERVDVPVRVLPEPELAAVRGALGLIGRPPSDGRGARQAGADPRATDAAEAGAADRVSRRERAPRSRNGRLLPVVAVVGVLLLGSGTALGATAEPAPPPSGTLVQYGYAITLPAGWEHTGGDPQRRRTLLTRTASPDGVELISVERSPLGYDTAAEPDRAVAELAAAHRAEGGLGELRPDTVAGRAVTRYLQQAGPAAVDWFVRFDGTDELVVGCRRPARGAAPDLERACADVVGSVRTPG